MSSSGAGTSRSDGGDGEAPDSPLDPAGGVLAGLTELHRLLGSREPGSCEAALGLLRSLGEECVICAPGSSVLALNTSLVFSKQYGLLVFVHKSLSIEEYRDCREEALKFLCTFLEKIDQNSQPYALEIKRICVILYTKEKYAKCKVAALDLLIKLLQLLKKSYTIEEFQIGEIFNKFYSELANKSKLSDTVLEKVYELLGILGEVQPSDMLNNSENLFRAYLGELKGQGTLKDMLTLEFVKFE
ncbi:DNA-dependent protein kinase catalytic subunit-like [Dendropsophus ebraccatus]|uniref:DNA-dependent protein kinase catalytic subunit-like n=1 Tax=Dendropsophus ebraccatus TaxID=150705 RepID=UPI0038313145